MRSSFPLLALAALLIATLATAMVPNDPLFPLQWESVKVGLPRAWDITMGSPDVVIAVIDTGVTTTNRELARKLRPGWNVLTMTDVTSRVANDHGDKLAGIAAAAANNGFGMAGVAPGCSILPIQITNMKDGRATTGNMADGLDWARKLGAKVAILAYDPEGAPYLEEAAKRFRAKGGLVFVAAGNEGRELKQPDSPAWITVTATDRDDHRYNVANYGPAVDLAAPGVKLTATSWYDLVQPNSSSGTSEATAFAAGVAALVFSANPKLTPDEVEEILKSTAVDLGAKGRDAYFGWGRVDAAKAVAAAKARRAR